MAIKANVRNRQYLFYCAITFLFINVGTRPFCKADEVDLDKVIWVDATMAQNYYGTCHFEESLCGLNNGSVCVQRGQCSIKGGQSSGDCQGGKGECCYFIQYCTADRTSIDVTQLVTTLRSPPVPTNTLCTFKLRKKPNICQVRLDFLAFNSEKANIDGLCETDGLSIRNSITVANNFTTCGNLQDQHMYLTFGSEDSIEVIPRLMRQRSNYYILATMIPCGSSQRAPDYCLQYYTTSSGRVKSFDFGGQQQSNQRYTICVNPTEPSTSVQWKPCSGGGTRNFDISTNVLASPLECNADWVQVKGLENVCEPFEELRSSWKPYELLVNFDEAELPPPPPTSTVLMDPTNPTSCEAQCSSQPGLYECTCVNQGCQCVINSPSVPVQLDLDNTGFCLEYSQL